MVLITPFLLFAFYILTGTGILWFHNRFRNTFSTIIISLVLVFLSSFFLHSLTDVLVFIGGSFVYWFVDAMYVYLKQWRYNTKNGYCHWVGIGWSYVTLVFLQLQKASNLFVLVLLGIAVLLLLSRMEHTIPKLSFEKVFVFLFFGIGLMFPKLFIVAFSMGLITEVLAVEVFLTWRYQYLSYIPIALGYAVAMIFFQILFEMSQGTASLFQIGLVSLIAMLFCIKFVFYSQLKPKSRVRNFLKKNTGTL